MPQLSLVSTQTWLLIHKHSLRLNTKSGRFVLGQLWYIWSSGKACMSTLKRCPHFQYKRNYNINVVSWSISLAWIATSTALTWSKLDVGYLLLAMVDGSHLLKAASIHNFEAAIFEPHGNGSTVHRVSHTSCWLAEREEVGHRVSLKVPHSQSTIIRDSDTGRFGWVSGKAPCLPLHVALLSNIMWFEKGLTYSKTFLTYVHINIQRTKTWQNTWHRLNRSPMVHSAAQRNSGVLGDPSL